MNRFFHKTIFNRNTGLMVAVAENTCNNGKSSKNKVFQVALFSLSGSLKSNLFDVQDGGSIGFNFGGNYGKGKANSEEFAYRNSHVGSRTGQTNITAAR